MQEIKDRILVDHLKQPDWFVGDWNSIIFVQRNGYENLGFIWNTLLELRDNLLHQTESELKLQALLLSSRLNPFILMEDPDPQLSESFSFPGSHIINALLGLKDFCKKNPRKTNTWLIAAVERFSRDFLGGKSQTFDESLYRIFRKGKQFHHGSLGIFLASFNLNIDVPDEPCVVLFSHSERNYIHLGKVSSDPRVQAAITYRDLALVRRDPLEKAECGNKPIVGISSIITPETEKTFIRLGFSPDKGVRFYYPSTLNVLGNKKIPDEISAITEPEEVLLVSVGSLPYSQENICKFMLEGQLPDVGIIVIPPETFFI